MFAVKNSSRTKEVYMFKKLVLLSVVSLNVSNSYGASYPKNVECFNKGNSFKILNEKLSENAKIVDVKGEVPFGGLSLLLTFFHKGYFNSQAKYTSMEGGTLTVSEQLFIGRGGCGRASCNDELKIINAHYESTSGDEFYYECKNILN